MVDSGPDPVNGPDVTDRKDDQAGDEAADVAAPMSGDQHTPHRHHHPHLPHPEQPVLVDKSDDRWEWRRKIRADPHKLRMYRVAVAIAGALLIVLGAASGPLPGPGGIPLVLLGLAVWASEFAWANRLMHWFKAQLHAFRGWSRPRQVLAWVIFFVCIGVLGYAYMMIIGVPVWLPDAITRRLQQLPGIG